MRAVAGSRPRVSKSNRESWKAPMSARPKSAVRLVSVMRQFEMLHKAISIGAEMNKKAVEEVARVGA